MISFSTRILKFGKQGEKTGWSYIEISKKQAQKLKPNTKVSFRVKGTIDGYAISKASLLPMGEGNFIFPLKGTLRKSIGKQAGDMIHVTLQADESKFVLSPDLMACLKEEPESLRFFKSLPGSHQKYYSNWIESAKTSPTKARRIAMALNGFAKKQGFAEMLRENKARK
ncbi:MAG: DUF1905 domain-containing protein [Bacteroidetes bacterium]|nr:DUF1905 domain-containing protein [Bacteroidota bacterium]MBS1975912.1 DUF1905 domain-containing protein [Bacteroidota bacterium]